jgi:hypothetical protein
VEARCIRGKRVHRESGLAFAGQGLRMIVAGNQLQIDLSQLLENSLPIVNGKVALPDLRLEYEGHDHCSPTGRSQRLTAPLDKTECQRRSKPQFIFALCYEITKLGNPHALDGNVSFGGSLKNRRGGRAGWEKARSGVLSA